MFRFSILLFSHFHLIPNQILNDENFYTMHFDHIYYQIDNTNSGWLLKIHLYFIWHATFLWYYFGAMATRMRKRKKKDLDIQWIIQNFFGAAFLSRALHFSPLSNEMHCFNANDIRSRGENWKNVWLDGFFLGIAVWLISYGNSNRIPSNEFYHMKIKQKKSNSRRNFKKETSKRIHHESSNRWKFKSKSSANKVVEMDYGRASGSQRKEKNWVSS